MEEHTIPADLSKCAIDELQHANGWKPEIQNEKLQLLTNPHWKLPSGQTGLGSKVYTKAPIPFNSLFRQFKETETTAQWDSANIETNKRVPLSDNVDLIHNVAKSPAKLLFSPRDFLSVRKIIKETNENNKQVAYFIAKSVEDSRFPILKGIVRAKIHIQAFRIEELNEQETDIKFVTMMEFGGSVPSFIMSLYPKRLAESFSDGLMKGYAFYKQLKE